MGRSGGLCYRILGLAQILGPRKVRSPITYNAMIFEQYITGLGLLGLCAVKRRALEVFTAACLILAVLAANLPREGISLIGNSTTHYSCSMPLVLRLTICNVRGDYS